jgi:hypothetical protein
MYRAMYERKYKTSADNLRDEDLAEFVWQWVCFHIPSGKLLSTFHLDRLPPVTKERRPPRRKLLLSITMVLGRLNLLLPRALRIPL